MRGCKMAVLVTLGLGVLARTARADEPLTVRIVTRNQASVANHILQHAQQEATRIFSTIDIRLEWTNVVPDSAEPYIQTASHLNITILRDTGAQHAGRILGVTERSADDRERLAYLFYRRIEHLAQLNGTDVALVFGVALAHELGHLLLPFNSHSPSGMMREEWDRARFRDIVYGRLAFSAAQAELIRTRVSALGKN